jgi:hypothetical protein
MASASAPSSTDNPAKACDNAQQRVRCVMSAPRRVKLRIQPRGDAEEAMSNLCSEKRSKFGQNGKP